MKRLFLLFLLPCFLLSQTITRSFSGTTATRAGDVTNLSTSNPITSWSLTFYLGTGLTAGTFQLDCAPDNAGAAGTYAACTGAIDGTTNPTSVSSGPLGGVIEIKLMTPHIAVNPTSLTGAGTWSAVLTGRFGASNLPTTITTSGGGGTPTTISTVCPGAIPTEVALTGTGYNVIVAASGSKKVSICNIAVTSATGGNPNVNTFTFGFGTTDCSAPTEFMNLAGVTGYTDNWFGAAQSAASGTFCVKESVANGDKVTVSILQQ